VGSGEWGVGSGEWGVGSGEWGVVFPLTTEARSAAPLPTPQKKVIRQ